MEFGIRFIGAVELLLSWLLTPIFFLMSLLHTTRLPPIEDDLLELSAVQLAAKIKTRQVSSEAVVSTYVSRIRLVNGLLNAVVEDRFDEAIEEAKRVDRLIYDGLPTDDKPFLGVPFTVKESCGLKGLSQSVGCRPREGTKCPEDGASVARLKSAGGIPLAVTNTPELCLCWETDNLITGRTNNPYNLRRTPGGSSGGEGALLGAGASVIGIASDIAGSIRIPAMFSGVYGHKPTPGYVSLEGHFPNSPDKDFINFLAVGPMARYAEDLRPLLKCIAGDSAKELKLDQPVDISNMKIYYKYDAGFSYVTIPVGKEISQAIETAIEFLNEKYGCPTIEADLGELIDSVEISTSVFLGMEGIPDLLTYVNKSDGVETSLIQETVKCLFGKSNFSYQGILFMIFQKLNMLVPKSKYGYYYQKAGELKSKFQELLGDDSVFLYPTYPIPAFRHHEFTLKTAGVMYAMIFNILGLPATHVPTGLDKQGLPIGFQVIGGPGQDRLTLAVAEALESKFGGWVPP